MLVNTPTIAWGEDWVHGIGDKPKQPSTMVGLGILKSRIFAHREDFDETLSTLTL